MTRTELKQNSTSRIPCAHRTLFERDPFWLWLAALGRRHQLDRGQLRGRQAAGEPTAARARADQRRYGPPHQDQLLCPHESGRQGDGGVAGGRHVRRLRGHHFRRYQVCRSAHSLLKWHVFFSLRPLFLNQNGNIKFHINSKISTQKY